MMFAIKGVLLFVFLLFSAKTAKGTKMACCEDMKALLKNITVAYQTVCLSTTDSRLSSNCCRNIEREIEKHRFAYKMLCPPKPHPTAVIPTAAPCHKTPLGIENGSIPDFAMISSSVRSVNNLPHFARLRNRLGDCAWVPASDADRNTSWLQLDLGRLVNVSAVVTQGSCSSDQWTKSYVLAYSENGVNWTTYREQGRIKIFTGNSNRTGIVTNHFRHPVAARYLKILPKTWHGDAALRLEVYTCHVSLPKWSVARPRSCTDHFKNGLNTNGYYNIYDASSNLITVYCDMTSEPGKAWTLVTSWSTGNKDMTEFRTTPFAVDSPVDENLPNWDRYRMSLGMMNDLSAQSTHWRATCSFPTHGVDYVDYVRGKFSDFNVVTFLGAGVCKKTEYLNIRGHSCHGCTSPWWSSQRSEFLHTDTNHQKCQFDGKQGATFEEDNFGYYGYINPKFRCTADASATTNWWFGGNVV